MAHPLTTGRLRNEFSRIRESSQLFVDIGGEIRLLDGFKIEPFNVGASPGCRRVVFSVAPAAVAAEPQPVTAEIIEEAPVEVAVEAEQPAEKPASGRPGSRKDK